MLKVHTGGKHLTFYKTYHVRHVFKKSCFQMSGVTSQVPIPFMLCYSERGTCPLSMEYVSGSCDLNQWLQLHDWFKSSKIWIRLFCTVCATMWVSLEQLKLQSRSKSQIQVEMSIDFLSWQEQTFYTCLQTEGLSFTWWACACHLLKEKKKKKKIHCQTKVTSTVCYWVLLLRAAAPQWWRAASCGLFEALECCGPWQVGGLFAVCCGELRGAWAWWCGTGGGSGPQHGQLDGATARSDSARFSAANLAPAQWTPESEEGQKY